MVTAVAAVVVALTALSSPVAASSADDTQIASHAASAAHGKQKALYLFSDAGRTVQCAISTYDTSDLRCDTVGMPIWQATPKPADCPLEWGNSIRLGAYELPHFGCVGDSLYNENQLPAGTVVDEGDFTCTILAPGVRCRQKILGHGFELALDHYTPVRPAAKNLLTPNGLGKLKLGMTVKRARTTGYLKPGQGLCGPAQLKRKWRGYVGWRKGRLAEVAAFPGTNINTRRGVGPGSTLAEAQLHHPGLAGPFETPVLSDSGTLWVYLERSKRGVLVFVLDASAPTERAPVGADLIRSIFTASKWSPRRGLASGC